MNTVDQSIAIIAIGLKMQSLRVGMLNLDNAHAGQIEDFLTVAADQLAILAEEVKRMREALDGLVGDAMRQTRAVMDVPTALARIVAEHAAAKKRTP